LQALRSGTTDASHFRNLAGRLGLVLAVAATHDLATHHIDVDTPLERTRGVRLDDDIVLVPVLRAGLGLIDAWLTLLPHARVGHIGLQRDERTAVASQYYAKLPVLTARSTVMLLDPMLATGGSAVAALKLVAQAGGRRMRLVCVVAAPDGIAAVEAACPDVTIFTAAVDRGLDPRKFILPGLGDFGDRLYGT
jgi:uracil phosphoribosyltransferase